MLCHQRKSFVQSQDSLRVPVGVTGQKVFLRSCSRYLSITLAVYGRNSKQQVIILDRTTRGDIQAFYPNPLRFQTAQFTACDKISLQHNHSRIDSSAFKVARTEHYNPKARVEASSVQRFWYSFRLASFAKSLAGTTVPEGFRCGTDTCTTTHYRCHEC